MHCPRCASELTEQKTAGAVWHLCRACWGKFVPYDGIDGFLIGDAGSSPTHAQFPSAPLSSSSLTCPMGHGALVGVLHGNEAGERATVDTCSICGGVWLEGRKQDVLRRIVLARSRAADSDPGTSSTSHAERLQFTGSGAEYFRIWVVNLFLTVLTLGIYSAWAKVRKARYFLQNTRLDGYVFDYHGAPVAVLRGRLIALVLLAAYTWGFDVSAQVGMGTLVLLIAVGPWLFLRGQQFKFGNTSWRGSVSDWPAICATRM